MSRSSIGSPHTRPASRDSVYSLIDDRSAIFRLETPSTSQQSLTLQSPSDFASALEQLSPVSSIASLCPAPAPAQVTSPQPPPTSRPWAPGPWHPAHPPRNIFGRFGAILPLRHTHPRLRRRRSGTFTLHPAAPPPLSRLPYMPRDSPADGYLYTVGGLLEAMGPVEDDCPICLERMQSGVVRLPCRHQYHGDCAKRWFKEKNNCPSCKHVFRLARK